MDYRSWRRGLPTLGALLLLLLSAPSPGKAGPGPDGCGDGIITPPEACDDGNTATDPTGATDTCSFPSCLPVVCGDGITNPDVGEQCDDQNTVDDDDCTNGCQSNCGNGVPNGTEQCDDGNTIDGDGCENDCSFTSFPVPPEIPCIAAANQNLAGVAKAEAGDAAACVKAIASGKDSAAGCLYLDAKGKVAKAQAKTIATFGGKKCDGVLPGVAVTDPTTVNAAGSEQTQNGVRAILGDPPPLATKDADNSGAACQAEALKQYGAVLGKYYAEAVKAKKAALKGGKGGTPPPADSGPELASALDTALGASQPLAKAGSKAAASIAKKCADGQVDALFDCNGAATASALAQCVVGAAKEAGCQALSLGDAIDMTCPTEL